MIDSPLAFPSGAYGHPGMTLRDYFAAQALTGLHIWDAVINERNSVFAKDGVDYVAKTAYAIADAMLKARGE